MNRNKLFWVAFGALTISLQMLIVYRLSAMNRAFRFMANASSDRPSSVEEPKSDLLIDTAGMVQEGDVNAPVTLVEFSDFQCPFCAKFAQEVHPKIVDTFVRTGKVRQVFRHYPLSIHKEAFLLAQVFECAGEQGKSWEMYKHIFSSVTKDASDLASAAESIGIDSEKLRECVKSGRYSERIRADMAEAEKNTIQGTPTFLLGTTEPGQNRMKVKKIIHGAQPIEVFEKAIAEVMPKS